MSNADENKMTRLYKQEMDQLIKKLSKQKNVPSSLETVSSLPSFKKNVKEKLSMQVPLKIKKFDIKSTSKVRDNFTTSNNNTNLLSHEMSKFPGSDTENMITVSAVLTVNNNNNIITNTFDVKENNHIQKEVTELISLVKLCTKEDRLTSFKNLLQTIKSMKRFLFCINNDKLIQSFYNLFSFYFLKFKFKVLDSDVLLTKDYLLDDLILNDDTSTIKIRNVFWTDLNNIYEIILFILDNDYDSYKKFLRDDFLTKLFWNLKSLDCEERQIIKLIFHKIYSVSFNHRALIIKLIERMLQDINYNSTTIRDVVCVNELFELMKSIITGLKKPIKLNIINLITRNIYPLLKSNFLKYFSSNIKNFINFLLTIDVSFIDYLVVYILKSWPVRYPEKTVLFLEIIENLLVNYENIINNYKKKLLKKVALSSKNTNFLVADKALILFREEKIFKMFIIEDLAVFLINCLVENVKSHWSNELKIISKLVISKYMLLDKSLNEKLCEESRKIIQSGNISNVSEELWDILKFNVKAD